MKDYKPKRYNRQPWQIGDKLLVSVSLTVAGFFIAYVLLGAFKW